MALTSLFKLDLHTHSVLSHDGGITEHEYASLLEKGVLDCVAITDHNEVDFALKMHEKHGEKVVVGEEIKTREGEVIGLFLHSRIEPHLSLEETIRLIREQEGLVCVPHPFSTNRSGVSRDSLDRVKDRVDCVEVFNPRAFFRKDNALGEKYILDHRLVGVSNSDAHCVGEAGRSFTRVSEFPTKANLVSLLSKGVVERSYAPLWHLLCPKRNTLRKKLGL